MFAPPSAALLRISKRQPLAIWLMVFRLRLRYYPDMQKPVNNQDQAAALARRFFDLWRANVAALAQSQAGQKQVQPPEPKETNDGG